MTTTTLNSLKSPSKRERTYLQLVESAVRIFADKGIGAAPIRDIASAAGLANGTFYNHFSSKAELLLAVAAHLTDDLSDRIAASVAGVDDPAEWVSVAIRRFAEKAAQDPVWGKATVAMGVRVGEVSEHIAANMTRDLEEGIARGRFKVPSRQAAADLVLGGGLMAMRSVSTLRAGSDHAFHIAALLLRGLGIDAAEADEIVHRPLPALCED